MINTRAINNNIDFNTIWSWNVNDLKNELRLREASVSGRKSELIQRYQKN